MITKLLHYAKPYRRQAFLSPLMVGLETVLEIFIPMLMAKIVDIGIANQDIAYVVKVGGLMIVMAILGILFGGLSAKFASESSMGFGSELRKALFNQIQSFSFKNVDHYSTPSLITRMTTDVNNAQMSFMLAVRIMVRAPVMLVCATFMAFSINSSLVTVFLVAIPVLATILAVIARLAYPRFMAMLKKYDRLNASVQENLIAIRVVKAFVRSHYEKEKFKAANDDNMRASLRAEKILICSQPAMQIAIYACIVAILWFGGNMVIGGTMLSGELLSFISYVSQILFSLMMIANIFISFVLSRASITRIMEVLSEQPDIADNAGEDVAVADGSIEFCQVTFRYAEEAENNILSGVNLSIRSGQTVGVIGGTGSAKTTLVQLIPRLYDVTGGELLVGGRNVKEYRVETLRNAVGMVLQKNVLFSGTIRENLRWGNENATDQEIEKACRAAQAHDFIMAFPEGYDTQLGQGGVNVSGGQKQRLCIARTLLKKPKIIILDDSTSAVDTATDAKIRRALKEEISGTTTIIIAQRITSVCDADQIIVLDDGKINAVGTHEELLETNEIYREVYLSQQKGVA